jgi:hypothetical protein
VTDGKFSPGEWDGALRQPLGDDFEVYLLADAEYLCVGFKYLKDVQADFLSEVYVATSDKQFVNLHSSGSLGEGVNDLPLQGGRTTFTIVAPLGASRAAWWESNATPRSVAGVQGKEFKISRARLPGGAVRFAGGMGVVNMTMRANAAFPKGHGFSSVEKWAELILPPSVGSAGREAAAARRERGWPARRARGCARSPACGLRRPRCRPRHGRSPYIAAT